MSVDCRYYSSRLCGSCSTITTPYASQLAEKQQQIEATLADWASLSWLAPVASNAEGFRNKAKMAVGGSVDAPTLGLVDAQGGSQDLAACLLYPASLSLAFEPLKRFIGIAHLVPYDIGHRRGELKFVLLTLAEQSGELMLRFVLRSREALDRIERHLPLLKAELPQLTVISANIQPLPAAIVEGDEEIALSAEQFLTMPLDEHRLFLRPKGFFQTNCSVASALYRRVREWVNHCEAQRVWDLYCGVGGFAVYCADGKREVLGIEMSAEAVEGARRTAEESAIPHLGFVARDAAALDLPTADGPDLLIVNPPRRGLGSHLCSQIDASNVRWLIYSSCNPATLAADLRRMPAMSPHQAQLLDMFPHTSHSEVVVLLERTDDAARD